jgi:hypothetical protein
MRRMGAAVDLRSEELRRLLVNAAYWCTGLESAIPALAEVSFVGDFRPSPFGFRENAYWQSRLLRPEQFRSEKTVTLRLEAMRPLRGAGGRPAPAR